MQTNIILIGMPGCGKSTLGVLLAKLLCKDFIDVDLLIQKQIGMSLQQYIDEKGVNAFLEAEADALCALNCQNTVIATGGSAPLTKRGANRLSALGKTVYLRLSYEEIEKRITNLATRGIAMEQGETLRDVYNARCPLYESIADLIFSPDAANIAETATALAARLKK
ncbi:MAG: shikimate kinase [Clostridia bacterium]|nr:shikimate kinase [Clostridia bacterium]